jgi:3D (Asp-Asp-Asp) domain-containing protein
LHSPERKKISGRALTKLVAEVQIGHRKPASAPVKKRETAVEQHIFCYNNMARQSFTHGKDRQCTGKLSFARACANGIEAAMLPMSKSLNLTIGITVASFFVGCQIMSAASDWSRFPLGTRFRIVDAKEEYIIDDYGTGLVGTNTIDLYKKTRLETKRWGVRQVDIDILEWGSNEQSLKVLGPRAKHKCVQRMILALQKKISPRVASRALN